jgi:hypothetical protein
MRKVKAKWSSRQYGIQLWIGPDSVVANLRFADDILLVGRSLHQLKQMINDVSTEGARVGLELHPAKTKILHNNIGYGTGVKNAKICGMDIEVLDPTGNTEYLGRALSLTDTHDVELKHRIKKAWAKFGMHRQELTDKAISLTLRLKLFNSVVTPSVLYGSSTWVMTSSKEAMLRTMQIQMMRSMLARRRIIKQTLHIEAETGDKQEPEIETWVEWVIRVTREARETMKVNDIRDWVDEQRDRRQRWANQLAKLEDGQWTKKVMDWQPEGWRARGRPKTRWTDQR